MITPDNTVPFPMSKLCSFCNNAWSRVDTHPIWYPYSLRFSSALCSSSDLFPPQIFVQWFFMISYRNGCFLHSLLCFIQNTLLLDSCLGHICLLLVDELINCFM